MSQGEQPRPAGNPPYLGDESLVINTRLAEIEKRQNSEKEEEREYKRRQLRFNRWTVVFTGLLVAASVVTNLIMLHQTTLTKESADAAKSAADTATENLKITKQVVTSGQAASFDITEMFWPAENPVPRMTTEITVQMPNRGILPATKVTAIVTFSRKDASGRLVEHSTHTLTRASVSGNGRGAISTLFSSKAPGDLSILRHEDIRVSGTITFDNGIGETIKQDFCNGVTFTGTTSYGFAACEDLDDLRKTFSAVP